MEDVRGKLRHVYSFPSIASIRPLLRLALTGRPVKRHETLPGNNVTIDEILAYGLIRLRDDNTLDMPYILLDIMTKYGNDPLLAKFPFHSSNEWESFEGFIAEYSMLLTQLNDDGSNDTLAYYHHGARFNNRQEAEKWFITYRCADQVIEAIHQTSTSTPQNDKKSFVYLDAKTPMLIKHETEDSDITPGTCVVRNAASAPYGDVFRVIELQYRGRRTGVPTSSTLVYESIQCKHTKNTKRGINMTGYVKELNKASSSCDVFILFTTAKTDIFIDDKHSLPSTVDGFK
jgi:hypothetical protein